MALSASVSALSLVLALLPAPVRADPAAAAACQFIAGNTYCSQTQHITYENFNQEEGSFQTPSFMDEVTGAVSRMQVPFSGSPFLNNETVSLHFRGPLQLNTLAVYSPASCQPASTSSLDIHASAFSSSIATRDPSHTRARRHSHHHNNARGFSVTATSSASVSYSSTPLPTAGPCSGNAWSRSSYYNAASQTADNIVFLNNLGGVNGSGTWSSAFGNSLSFAGANGHGAAAAPQTLEQTVIPSNVEIIVKTGQKCGDNCPGFVRGGPEVAYHGFKPEDSIFIVELLMPHDNVNSPINNDMPAFWMLNSRIADCGQYSPSSCWDTGCGEFDILEVLDPGNERCTSHLHIAQGGASTNGKISGGGGSPDWIARPVQTPKKFLVYFKSAAHTIDILALDDSFVIGDTITQDQLSAALAEHPASIFTVPS
ncbi:Protein TOS1 [Neolecta irregularis DAH-3]|uniref:glucan endo-1,3-beta-D-glucosidase n=1 Tax=Neolecta irregularis (strain DAH-3) TaxID=1198029 RepID=A0A1U7LIH0_NEOID|nr:Protein TOS1 [Neolecta irregularis DAH-3]|eukprot:OLL22439.1 Protein TOS1 [Neolecta irregularis DAH-3]